GESRDPTEEEDEPRVEARPLDRVVADLVGERPRRRLVAPRRGVRLALRVEPRVGRGAVHDERPDHLAGGGGDADRHRARGRFDDGADDGERLIVRHEYACRARSHGSSSHRIMSGSTPRASASATVRSWNGTMSTTGWVVGTSVTSQPISWS